jgi:formylglycine-generating enzyme required for sulfatase activity
MKLYDIDGSRDKSWRAPARISISTNPKGAVVALYQYIENKSKRLILTDKNIIGNTPIIQHDIQQGSYLLIITLAGYAETRYPILVSRGENLDINVSLFPENKIPANFVYVPAGRFLFGTGADEALRKGFLISIPIHEVKTGSYLIGKHEVSFGEWIEFLDSLPVDQQKQYAQSKENGGLNGAVQLERLTDGRWQLSIRPGEVTFTSISGNKLTYNGRKSNSTQDWLRMPVCGIVRKEAEAYANWLNKTGRLKGARLCSDHEWERAARGADNRDFPSGNQLNGEEANIDESYAKDPSLVGPDEVGTHPNSVSPFGVHDMAGNAWEWVTSSIDPNESVNRSGGFFHAAFAAQIVNRAVVAPNYRDSGSGMRICASLPE